MSTNLIAVRDRNGVLIRRIGQEFADRLEGSNLVERVGGHRLRYLRANIVWREPDRVMPQVEYARTGASDDLIRRGLRAFDHRKVTAGPAKTRRDLLLFEKTLIREKARERALSEHNANAKLIHWGK